MNIYTDLILNKQYNYAIRPSLLKHSQEYRILATLRYLFPQKYNKMTAEKSPNSQDHNNGIGIEVSTASQKDGMKATTNFTNLCPASNKQEVEKYKRIIESCKYSFVPTPNEISAISTTGTSHGKKNSFQEIIRKKLKKLHKYKDNFKVLGLAIILPDIPTSETEIHFIDWIRKVFQENDTSFDFVFVLSHHFCIFIIFNRLIRQNG